MANTNCLGGFMCSRNALIVLNALYIVIAFVLIGVAAYAKVVAYIVDISVMGGIIACGVFLLIIACVGLVGTLMHHQVTLFFYIVVLFLLFLIQFIVACACLAIHSGQQMALFRTGWYEAESLREKVQTEFQCCGAFRADQPAFDDTKHLPHPPCVNVTSLDCCKNSTASCCTGLIDPSEINGTMSEANNVTCPCEPCWDKISYLVNGAVKAAGGVGLFFSFTEAFGVWLGYRFRNQKNPNADPNNFL